MFKNSNTIAAFIAFIFLAIKVNASCWDGEGFWKCRGRYEYSSRHYGYVDQWGNINGWFSHGWNTQTCYNDWNGNMNACWNPWNHLYTYEYNWGHGSRSDTGRWYYNEYYHFWNWGGNIHGSGYTQVYLKCHDDCTACDHTGSPDDHCTACDSGYYKWVQYERCKNFCPHELNDGSHSNYYQDDDIGQIQKSSGNACEQCSTQCAICDGLSNTNCYTCRFNSDQSTIYYLISDAVSTCQSRFTKRGYYNSTFTCYTRRCWHQEGKCPDQYYFPVSQYNSIYSYSSWSDDWYQSSIYGSGDFYPRRNSPVCYMCDEHCESCKSHTQSTCKRCLHHSYMWKRTVASDSTGYCSHYCPMGTFTGSDLAEYIDQSQNDMTTGSGTRLCKYCQSKCTWCRDGAYKCYGCKDNNFLLDLHQECKARFGADNRASEIGGIPICTRCRHPTYDMCNNSLYSNDTQCVSSCPTYMYFPTTEGNSGMWQTNDVRYNTFNANRTQQYFNDNNQSIYDVQYRRYTPMCKLCDYRCIKCTGPLNIHCTVCANFYYKWQPIDGVPMTVCDNQCPPGQYIALDNFTTWANETECNNCHDRCQLCEIYKQNCSLCHQFPNGGLHGFLFAYNDTYSECLEFCEPSTDPTSIIGYYGSIKTMYCYPCPSPCSNCNIKLIMDHYPDIDCGTDEYCNNGLICTDCLEGYVNVAGKCILDQNCRENSYYQQSDVASQWSAINCKCFPGHSMSGAEIATCDIRCHLTCKTCDGTGDSDCLSCENGHVLDEDTGKCEPDNSIRSYKWYRGNSASRSWSEGGLSYRYTRYINSVYSVGGANVVPTKTCGNFTSYWGYQNQDGTAGGNQDTDNKYFGLNFDLYQNKYYAIEIKIQLIFIDEFNEQGSVYISRDSNTSVPDQIWQFDTKEGYGESLCGDNRMDYVMSAIVQIPSINRTTQTFYIRTNEDLLEQQLGYQLHWGFNSIMISALKCHPLCNYCDGPSENDCLSCSTTGYVAVDGECICDIENGFYAWPTDDMKCNAGCPLNDGWFTDDPTRSCVQPPTTSNCSFPKIFGDQQDPSTYGQCVSSCPGSLYASQIIMKCTDNCIALDQYEYDGALRTCETVCPGGLFRDPDSKKCVQKCPPDYYLEIDERSTNPYCTDTCTDWEYPGLQICVEDCPNDYFKQVIGGHNKCVIECTNSFADLTTGQCVTQCPFPTYADVDSRHCVETCSNPSKFMQVAVSNLNRTCVETCEAGQYGNPFTQKCSNYTRECPDGYYADYDERMCVTNCSQGTVAENSTKFCDDQCTTGFAYWTDRVCVQICPSDPEMYGNLDTKECVPNCDHATTGLYGDYQANRTCVETCSSSPVSLFGHNDTSKCVDMCPNSGEYADPDDPHRRCVQKCSSSPRRFYYTQTRQCLLECPDHHYKHVDPTLGGVCLSYCPDPLFADPVDNMCRPICKWGWWGLPVGIRPCVQTCPYDWFAMNLTSNRLCVTLCDDGYWGDLETSMCYNDKTLCSNDTYADEQKRLCVINTNCTEGTFADPNTKGCEVNCSNGLLKDQNINTCVQMCSDDPDQYDLAGLCRSSCVDGAIEKYADWQYNRTCRSFCSRTPLMTYGDKDTHRCVEPYNCPQNHYGHNDSRLCQNPCFGDFPFGDNVSMMCVEDCPDGTWGDGYLHLCMDNCSAEDGSPYFADNHTGNCQTLCTLGTFGVNNSDTDTVASCQFECPPGSFARDSDRICVSNCGDGLYGDPIKRVCYSDPHDCSDGYYGNSIEHLCVLPEDCQTTPNDFLADNASRLCISKCILPQYGDSNLRVCVDVCPEDYFGQNTTRLCLEDCNNYPSLAEDQNNLCVERCSDTPVRHFGDWQLHKCVKPLDCSVDSSGHQTYARNASQQCEAYCLTDQWADPTTFMCVAECPTGYYGDTVGGKRVCVTSCAGTYRYRDNYSKTCVSICPIDNSTFGDENADLCVHTCPVNYFAQVDTNRRCVDTCKATTWGNAITRICITDPVNECPPQTWADDYTHLCMSRCSDSQNYYGFNDTRKCQTYCPDPTFAYDATRVCIDVCPPTLNDAGYFGDPGTSPRKCYKFCQTPGLYRDHAASRTCATSCTHNNTYRTYKDPTTMSCEAVCSRHPQVRYINDLLKQCVLTCEGNLKKDEGAQKCVQNCPGLYDPTTDRCVENCPRHSSLGVLYADMVNMICVTAANCPSNTYGDADNNLCVQTCPNGTYIHGKRCVYFCPDGYYFDNVNQKCVVPLDCPDDFYADNRTRSCVSQCLGSYADTVLKICIDVCYGTKYGDPFTHKCQDNCSNGLHRSLNNNSCEADCNNGTFQNPENYSCSSTCDDPYYADRKLGACVEVCSSNPTTFATINADSQRVCVQVCAIDKMHDIINRECVGTCPPGTYAYTVNMSCVAFCPGPTHYKLGTQCVANCSGDATLQYADELTRQCVSTCPDGTYKDDLSYKCVSSCPESPVQYFISEDDNACVPRCPNDTYADRQEMRCVTECSLSPRTYAQQLNNQCVEVCPLSEDEFADPTTGFCVETCPAGYYADSRDRTCKQNCSFLFSDPGTTPPSCVQECSGDLFADQLTFKCQSSCPDFYYGHIPSKTCVQFCPYGYYADTEAGLCVEDSLCPQSHPYADNLTHLCTDQCTNGQWGYLQTDTTSGGKCVDFCPQDYYSNPRTNHCQLACPDDLFAQDDNNTCVEYCPYDQFMDFQNNKCVDECPEDDGLFADLFNRSCVTDCDPLKNTYADDDSRKCQRTCTGDKYADDLSQTCVGPLGCPSSQFSDPFYKKCVDVCYNGTYGYQGKCIDDCPTDDDDVYASQDGYICVEAENCPSGTYGDPVLHKCVQFCPIQSGTFADDDSHKCVYTCDDPLYADNVSRRCVERCPNVSLLFGENISNVCVQNCPPDSYADLETNLCAEDCPDGTFADDESNWCVQICPEGTFGNNITNQCVTRCPGPSYFGDPELRICVLYCEEGKFADIDNNRQCHSKCLLDTKFSQNSTNQCLPTCLTGFANQRTGQCIQVCTAGYYGHNKLCMTGCPISNPPVFADDSTNLCKQTCPDGTFADPSTKSCVKVCPMEPNYFGLISDKKCVTISGCGTLIADETTRLCVSECPSSPALYKKLPERTCLPDCPRIFGLYADNSTRSCKDKCPDGTYADPTSMKCEPYCPINPLLFGENETNKCVEECDEDRDMYADNKTGTCVFLCTEGTFADLESRTCVTTCPEEYFARNDTRRCVSFCPQNTFADELVRICVERCSIDPIFYGDPLFQVCRPTCLTGSFGNPLTQQCIYNTGGHSNCPEGYYGDQTTMLCVQKCPMIEDLYGDPVTRMCEISCTGDLIADNSTMTCVEKCPQFPNYYAFDGRCQPFCPEDTFADDISRECVETCPNDTYAENHTNRCVETCQQQPIGFADDTTWQCVEVCPDGYFADNSTMKCVERCPEEENTFGYDGDNTCMRICPQNTYADEDSRKCLDGCSGDLYADDTTNRCVPTCPKYPPLYADPNNNRCTDECTPHFYAYEGNRSCVEICPGEPGELYRDRTTRSCVDHCDYEEGLFGDNLTGFCELGCSNQSWADPIIHVCVAVCPDQPLMYADNSTNECVVRCPGQTYGDNATRSCVDECPPGSLSLPDLNLCMRYCPIGYFAHIQTAFCQSRCEEPLYGDPSTRTCVDSCPISQLLYADSISRQCVNNCPDGSYADRKSVKCVSECPIETLQTEVQTYAADYNNMCVEECSMPFYADIFERKCVTNCPDGYYNDVKDHICHQCKDQCTRCTTYDVCTACAPLLYLQMGSCVEQCQSGYYARNTTMTCVGSYTCKPLFGVNQTHTCEITCPDGSYKNTRLYRCDACQETCLTCTSWNVCQNCDESISEFAQNFCWPFCSVEDEDTDGVAEWYYDRDNSTCVDECPNNTYLDVVFCKPCHSTCDNCDISSTNCTLCAQGLYLKNEQCVQSCGSQYKPVIGRICQFCGTSCGDGLTFDTNVTMIDGESNIFMTFSDDIILNGNVQDIFALQSTSRRRFLAPRYRIVVVDSRTIQIILIDGADASDFQVLIVNPQNIQDVYGNLPASVRSQVKVDLSNMYTTNMDDAPSGFSTYMQVLSAMCVISFLFDIEMMKFFQLVYIHYFVGIILPPQLSKVLVGLRWSTLDYLPEMFKAPEPVLRQNVPGKIYDVLGDYSFLRNAGFVLTPLAIIVLIWAILKILSIPQINRFKTSRIWIKQLLEQKFKFAFQLEFLGIIFAWTTFCFFLQIRDYKFYDTFTEIGIFISIFLFFFIVCLFAMICYRIITFFIEYPKLSDNLKKATDLILQEGEYHKLNSANIFLFQMKKIDLRNILYPKVNNQNILPFRMIYRFTFLALCCIPVTFLRAIILSAIIALGHKNTLLQMSLCIILNTACLLYFSRARPYSFKFKKRRIRNYIAIFNEVALIGLEFLILSLAILDRDNKSAFEKDKFSKRIIIYIAVVATINLIYFLFRVGVHIYRKIWVPFTHSELFRINFPEKYAEIHGLKAKKLLRGVDPKAKEALRAMIKNYKKHKSELRPNQEQKANPQLPMKYKITYFDRDSSSIGSKTSMSKKQRRQMLKTLFHGEGESLMHEKEVEAADYEEVVSETDKTEAEYEEYEQEIQIKVKDLAKYVKNADELIRLKRMKDDDEAFD